jgi:pimeloyl-ACP methyl ester carboxylesterase
MLPVETRHHYIQTNGITLHLVEAGLADGPLVVMLHGFPEFWYGWRHQIPALANAGYHVWAPDQRGYHLSSRPPEVSAYRQEELVADIAGLIQQSGQEQVYLVGHDWGAAVAWQVAAAHPELLKRLVILNVPHPTVMFDYVLRSWEQRFRSWYVGFFQIPWLPETLLRLNNWQGATQAMVQSGRPDSFSAADLERYRRAWSVPRAMTSMINWYRAIVRHPPLPLPQDPIEVPTLIIWGAQDVALSSEMAKLSLDFCDQGQLVMIEEATHWVQHDEPDKVNSLLLDFLAQS